MSATATVFVGIPIRQSCFSNFPAPIAQFLRKLVQNVFKNDAVDVLAQEVYKEPITDKWLAYHLKKEYQYKQ